MIIRVCCPCCLGMNTNTCEHLLLPIRDGYFQEIYFLRGNGWQSDDATTATALGAVKNPYILSNTKHIADKRSRCADEMWVVLLLLTNERTVIKTYNIVAYNV